MNDSKSEYNSPTKRAIFNNKYELLKSIGHGKTSKVYLCRSLADPSAYFALKIIKEEFICHSRNHIQMIEQEISILRGLKHKNIIQLVEYGIDGSVIKNSKEINNLTYILLEYV